MIDIFKRFFGNGAADGMAAAEKNREHAAIVAVCALFLEMGRIDETFTQEEMARVLLLLKNKYGLSEEEAEALVEEADRELEESVDLWQFARVVNEQFSNQEKEALVRRLWRIVYVDGKMDMYEHYLMNKLTNLLRLSPKQVIDAKIQVLHEK